MTGQPTAADLAVRTTCPYCGVGCGVLATPRADGSIGIAGDPMHPSNLGRLCSKGSALGETLSLDDRLIFPEIAGGRVSWDQALDLVATTFAATVALHGPDSVAFYVSGQLLTEDYYVANKLMKGFIGSGNIDTNSRLCMASSVAGHKRAFGADVVPGNYEDLELADLVVLTGSNLAWCHPVLYQRIAAAKAARPEMRIVVIDPRRTMTTDIADLHLPIGPDGDTALFVGLLGHLEQYSSIDTPYIEANTSGLAAALAIARDWSVARVAEATGLDPADVQHFYTWFETTPKVVTVYSQGVNQSATGTDKVNAIINCHLATGRIGLPGTGPFSVTGQPNAMGGREVGGLANVLAAHMDFDPASVERVGRFWNSDRVAIAPGHKAVQLFEAVRDGRIKALWIMATSPVDSMPEADLVRSALRACPFVVVSDVTNRSDTLAEAAVRLPALGWGEKDGTVTSSERRISRQRPFLSMPGEARADWWIICEVARRMGFGAAFDFAGPAEIFDEHARLSALDNDDSRAFDLSGLVGADYANLTPVQWPVRPDGTARMFTDGKFRTPDRRGHFVPVVPPPPLRPSPGMLTLNTGRVRDHWHTMTRTGKTARLSAHLAEPFAEIHPADATRFGIRHASLVRLENAQGQVIVRALLSGRQRQGSVFVPMHWTDQFASNARIDTLVRAKTDPQSGQPALKMSEVAITPAGIRMYGFAVSATRPGLAGADYWAMARSDAGHRSELGWFTSPEDWTIWMQQAFGLSPDAQIVSNRDERSGRFSFAAFSGEQLDFALFVSPDPVLVSRQWATTLLTSRIERARRAEILSGRPSADRPDPGPIVCACNAVGARTIGNAVSSGHQSVEAIGLATGAGTNCGSCRAEITTIINANRIAAK